MKYIKLYKIFESNSSLDETEDIFLEYLDDNRCHLCNSGAYRNNEYIKCYAFAAMHNLKNVGILLESSNKDNWFIDYSNWNLFVYNTDIRDFIFDKLNECKHTTVNYGALLHKKDVIAWYNPTNKILLAGQEKDCIYLNRDEIWNILAIEYKMSDSEIRFFMRHILSKYFDLDVYLNVDEAKIRYFDISSGWHESIQELIENVK